MGQKGFGNRHAGHGGGLAIVLLAAALAGGLTGSARAAQIIEGEQFDLRIDTTLAAGVSVRATERNAGTLFQGNRTDPSAAGSNDPTFSNMDDGNLNYDRGDVTSTAAKLTVEVEGVYREVTPSLKDVGFFVRLNGFYDVVQSCSHCTRRTPLAPDARHRSSVVEGGVVGTQFRVLDAYGFGTVDVLDRPLEVRFGNQVISWGESLFIPGGINQINGFDVAKYRSPGSEIKEALVPAPAVRLSGKILDGLGFETYYQFAWFRTQVDPVGTFFSTNDLIGRGAGNLYGGADGGGYTAATLFAPKNGEDTPSDQGQWGFALRYFVDPIASEFGAYYIRYHSKQPAIGFRGIATVGAPPPFDVFNSGIYMIPTVPGGYYTEQYAEGVDMAGASFSTEVFGAALAGEISYRPNDPVPISGVGTTNGATFPNFATVDGYVREKRIQAQTSLLVNLSGSTRIIGPIVGFLKSDDLQFIAEAAVVHFPDLARICPLQGYSTTPCVTYGAGPGRDVDATSFGYQLMMRGNWANPVDVPITLTPRVSFAHDAVGDTPGQLPFIEDRTAVSVGLAVDYQATWVFDVGYTNFMGAGTANLNGDRDFVAASLTYSF